MSAPGTLRTSNSCCATSAFHSVVEGVVDEAGRKIEIFSEHMTGLDFYLDPRAVDASALERIRETLKNAIAALEGRVGVEAPVGSHDRTESLFPLASDKST